MNWVITLGRFDIQYAVSTMARYNSAPRSGHLKALIRVFGYLKKFDKGRLLIDPTLPEHEKYPYDDLNSWQDSIQMQWKRYPQMHLPQRDPNNKSQFGWMLIMLGIK